MIRNNLIGVTLVLATLFLAGCSGDGIDGTGLSGTAAIGAPISNAQISIKSSDGVKRSTTTDENGKFNLVTTDMKTPILLRVSKQDGDYLYGVATSNGVANVHPLTDLIIRNWYKVQSSDVEIEFEAESALTIAPSATDIGVLKAVIREIFKALFAEFNVPDDFDIIESLFDADGIHPFDQVLDHLSISYKDGKVKIEIRDDETEIETEITDDLNDDDDIKLLDTIAPVLATPPTSNILAVAASATKIIVVWDAATDNIAVAGYNVFRNDGASFTTPYPVFVDDNSIAASTEYCYQIQAYDGALDAAGLPAHNLSATTTIDTFACASSLDAPDIDLPLAPQNLMATTLNPDSIALSWVKSTSADVIGYHIYRGDSGAINTKITSIIGNTYTDSGLTVAKSYCYTAVAFDAAGNESPASLDNGSDNCAEIVAAADVTPPTTIANPAGGNYNSAQSVTLVCTDDVNGSGCAATYYTLDGSEPTTLSAQYADTPITISTNTTLRFFSVDVSGQSESSSVNIETYTFTATQAQLVSIDITSASTTIYLDTSLQLIATGNYDDNNTQDLSSSVLWDSSDPTVLSINSQGIATALAVGSTNVTVTHLATGVTSLTPLSIVVPTLLSITVSPDGPPMTVGMTRNYVATGTYDNNSTRNMTILVTWESSNISVATFSPVVNNEGIATAVGMGSSTITATDPQTNISDTSALSVVGDSPPFFVDDFENGTGRWLISGFDWTLDTADSVSPGHSFTDSLNGDFIANANATLQLLSTIDLSTSVNPVLTFWQKYDIPDCVNLGGDRAIVEVSSDGGIGWTTLVGQGYCWTVSSWTPIVLDLSAYKSASVLVRFRLRANGNTTLGSGWSIDDVTVRERDAIPQIFPFSDNLETGTSKWLISGSDWDIVNTDSIIPGQSSFTDSPAGEFTADANSTLTLATPVDLSGTVNPVLSFWHKYNIPDCVNLGGDRAIVEASGDGGVTWTSLVGQGYCWAVSSWTPIVLDLSPYQNSPSGSVLVRFRLRANGNASVGDWSIDDIEIKERDPATALSFPFSDELETGTSNWLISGNDWDIVSTDSILPGQSSFTDSPTGEFAADANSTLTLGTPVDLTGTVNPVLTFWHKYNIPDCVNLGGDRAIVEASGDGGVTWTSLVGQGYCWTVSTWTPIVLDLSPYQTSPSGAVLVRFRLRANGNAIVGDWSIDNVEIKERDPVTALNFPFSDNLETGTSNWLISGNDWDIVSTDSILPGQSSFTDSPTGEFAADANSTLTLGTPVDLTGTVNPVLTFWHKYNIPDCVNLGGDRAIVEASGDGGVTWTSLVGQGYCWTVSTWTPIVLDLSPYQTSPSGAVLVRFRMRANGNGSVGDWSIDNVEIKERDPAVALTFPFSDNLEAGSSNWMLSGTDWALADTNPSVPGPQSFSDSPIGNFLPDVNSTLTLITPVDLTGMTTAVLSFAHKFDIPDCVNLGGDRAIVEASSDGGITWTSLVDQGYCGQVASWTPIVLDLSSYTSLTLIRFRLRANGNLTTGDGWFVDNIEIR